MRTFEDSEAKRTSVPLLIGLTGPSGGGKTYSALRLATGIQRVTGGEIFVIDTEARRALHYADAFKFRHIAFGAPFGPLDYLAAVEHCVKRGAKVVIVDSMSHEHEGPGGVLEMHAAETKRLAAAWHCSESKAQLSAWAEPKSQRRRMINTLLQLPVSGIFCFRAKEKLKIVQGQDPKPMGFMPIAGEEFTYEMTINALLLPRANGVPTWQSAEIGERLTMKLPRQFEAMLARGGALCEEHGEAMARWAAGGARKTAEDFASDIAKASTVDELKIIGRELAAAKRSKALTPAECDTLTASGVARKAEIEAAPEHDPVTGEVVSEPGATREPGED